MGVMKGSYITEKGIIMISKTRTICMVQQAYYGVNCVHEIRMKQNATTYNLLHVILESSVSRSAREGDDLLDSSG